MKKLELILISLWAIPAFFLAWFFSPNYIVSALIFYLPLAVFLSIRLGNHSRRVGLVSFLITLPSVTILDYFGHKDGSWFNPSLIGVRIFGEFPVEDFLWFFLFVYTVIGAYEYLFDDGRVSSGAWKIRNIRLYSLVITFVFCITTPVFFSDFSIPYFYAIACATFFIAAPLIGVLFFRKLKKVFLLLPIFATSFFLYELVSVMRGHWFFPGDHFLAKSSLFGVMVPVEELFWIFLIAPAGVVLYELIADDRK
ncbi:MAG: hypothetical protein KBD19_03450 [Candidatus Moranbacteria bacterium]|nr:hypothetical protein [Candidatus Moranbacteria bacterium]